jgi:hypothetical protein
MIKNESASVLLDMPKNRWLSHQNGSHIISDGVAQGYVRSKAVFRTAYQIGKVNDYERFN